MENSLIKDIGRSYIVSSLLPAAFFVSLGLLVFRGLVPRIIVQRVIEQDEYYGGQLLLFIFFLIWVAFALYSATDWTIRLFEGYLLPKPLRKVMKRSLKRWQRKKTKRIRKAITYKSGNASDIQEYFDSYYPKARVQYENIEKLMPIETDLVMPTRFGNILLSSELYPQKKYGINGLAFWTRMTQVMSPQFQEMMEEKNNQMIFLLNSSLLSYILGFLGVTIGALGLPCQIFFDSSICIRSGMVLSQFFTNAFVDFAATDYLLIGVFFLLIAYAFYRFSLPAAEAFGLIVRSAFDLYRHDLLRQLNYPIPATTDEEITLWKRISEYVISGNEIAFAATTITYSIRKNLLDGVDVNKFRADLEKNKYAAE